MSDWLNTKTAYRKGMNIMNITYHSGNTADRYAYVHKTVKNIHTLECGLMPNVMAALPNIGGTLCEGSVIPFLVPRRKVWLTPAAQVPCNNAANI